MAECPLVEEKFRVGEPTYSSTLMLEAAGYFETFAYVYQSHTRS
jgi:hypothetical protein